MDNNLPSIHALAYFGDAVIELLVRERLISTGISSPGELTKMSRAFVTAQKQSACVEKILSYLSEEESNMFRRGRNMHGNHPKSASVAEYRRATGFEVLMGYLYKTDNCQRAKQLFSLAYEDELNALPSSNA